MITLHVNLAVRNAADTETVAELLAEHARLSRGEPGCLRFELLQSREQPTQFFIVEDWESAEALDAHREAKAFTTIFAPRVTPLAESHAEEVLKVGPE